MEEFRERTNKIIFLGTFFELSKITNIGANYLRGFFLFCLFFLTPVTHGEILPFLFIGYFLGFLLLRTRFFGFLFSLGLGVFFTILLVPSVILFGLYLSDFHIENMYIFQGIPSVFSVGMVLGIFSLILFILYFFRYAFKKKFFGIGFIVTAIVSFVVAICLGFVTFIHITPQLSSKTVYSQKEFVFEKAPAGQIFNVFELSSGFFKKSDNIFGIELVSSYSYYPQFFVSPDDKVHAFFDKSYAGITGGEDVYDISGVEVLSKNPYLVVTKIKNSGKKYPSSGTVFVLQRVLIPKNMRFTANLFNGLPWYRQEDVIFPEMAKYSAEQKAKIIRYGCGVWYFDDNKKLNCEITKSEIDSILAREY